MSGKKQSNTASSAAGKAAGKAQKAKQAQGAKRPQGAKQPQGAKRADLSKTAQAKKPPGTLFWASVCCMFLLSASPMFMLYASDQALNTGERWWMILSGCLFWAPLIAGYVLFGLANRYRKHHDALPIRGIKNWGAFRLANNRLALAAEVSFLLGVTGVVVFSFAANSDLFTSISLCLAVFALHMHCVLNGANYKYYME